MLMAQSGLLAYSLPRMPFVFLLFWELALIPCTFFAVMGRERRIPVTFKFFVYTFTGHCSCSLASYMYISIPGAPVYLKMVQHPLIPFALNHFIASLTATEQNWLFWLFFIVLPSRCPFSHFIHGNRTPGSVANTSDDGTSGIMVKMGLWCIPLADPFVFPEASVKFDNIIAIPVHCGYTLPVAGPLYRIILKTGLRILPWHID